MLDGIPKIEINWNRNRIEINSLFDQAGIQNKIKLSRKIYINCVEDNCFLKCSLECTIACFWQPDEDDCAFQIIHELFCFQGIGISFYDTKKYNTMS